MWKTTNYKGEEITFYSEKEVKEKFALIKALCTEVYFQTKEANRLQEEILNIIKEKEKLNEN